MADAEAFTPDSASRAPHSTKSRRQTVRISHDSLFSSMEVSNSGSVSTVTGKNTTVDQSMGKELPNSTMLTSAMSLTGILEPTDANKLLTLEQAFEPTRGGAGGFGWTAGGEGASDVLTEGRVKGRSTRKRSAATCLDDLEALGAKVSEMNLEGLVGLVTARPASMY